MGSSSSVTPEAAHPPAQPYAPRKVRRSFFRAPSSAPSRPSVDLYTARAIHLVIHCETVQEKRRLEKALRILKVPYIVEIIWSARLTEWRVRILSPLSPLERRRLAEILDDLSFQETLDNDFEDLVSLQSLL